MRNQLLEVSRFASLYLLSYIIPVRSKIQKLINKDAYIFLGVKGSMHPLFRLIS